MKISGGPCTDGQPPWRDDGFTPSGDLRLAVFFDLNGIFCYDAINFWVFPYGLFQGGSQCLI